MSGYKGVKKPVASQIAAKLEEEAHAATKASIIVVYGDVLDKIGFGLAERANRSAEIRLSRTLNTLEVMAVKEHAKYRKEKINLQTQLDRLNNCRVQLKRDKLKKRLTADDLHEKNKQTITDILKPVDPDKMVSTITYKPVSQPEGIVAEEKKENVGERLCRGKDGKFARHRGTGGRSFRELKRGLIEPFISFTEELMAEEARIKEEEVDVDITLPTINDSGFMTGNIQFTQQNGGNVMTRPSSNMVRRCAHRSGPSPMLTVRSQSASHIAVKPSTSGRSSSLTDDIPPSPSFLLQTIGKHGGATSSESVDCSGAVERTRLLRRGHMPPNKLARMGMIKVDNEWLPPEKEDLLLVLREERKVLQKRIDDFLTEQNPK